MWCCSFFLFDCSNNLDFGICDMLVTCLKTKTKNKQNITFMFTVMHGNESVQCYLETYSVLMYRILQIKDMVIKKCKYFLMACVKLGLIFSLSSQRILKRGQQNFTNIMGNKFKDWWWLIFFCQYTWDSMYSTWILK